MRYHVLSRFIAKQMQSLAHNDQQRTTRSRLASLPNAPDQRWRGEADRPWPTPKGLETIVSDANITSASPPISSLRLVKQSICCTRGGRSRPRGFKKLSLLANDPGYYLVATRIYNYEDLQSGISAELGCMSTPVGVH